MSELRLRRGGGAKENNDPVEPNMPSENKSSSVALLVVIIAAAMATAFLCHHQTVLHDAGTEFVLDDVHAIQDNTDVTTVKIILLHECAMPVSR